MIRQIYQKLIRQWFIALITIGIPSVTSAQSVDSLILHHTASNGKVNVKSVLDEIKTYVYSYPSETFKAGKKLVKIAEKQQDPLQKAQSYQFLGTCYFQVKAAYDSATYYLQQAEQIYSSLDSEEGTNGRAMISHNFGTIKQVQGEYAEAIDYYIRALKLSDKTGELKIHPYTLNNIATLYGLMNDHQKAEKYARECISIARKLGDELMEATGSIELSDALMAQGKYAESLLPLEVVLEYGKAKNDPYKVFLYHLNYGDYLMDYKKDYPSAVRTLEKAHKLADSIGDDWEIMRHSSALSEAYLANKQFEEASTAAQNALQLGKRLQSRDKMEIALSVLAKVNAEGRNFETAYQQSQAAYLLKDTLSNENNQQHIAFLETMYQTEKKELKIEALEKQRRLYIWLGVAGALILLVALAFAIIRYRLAVSRRKLAEQESKRLEQEKQLVAVQATLDGEAAERSRLAKDLHDGLGSMLSVVKFNLPQVKGNAILEAVDVSRFQKALGMLDNSIQELRRVAHHIMPESLLRYGLKVSLSDFCDAIPIVSFHYFGDEARLSDKLEILIYRCIHELINNALKHAQATHINVQLIQEVDRISFTVQDDGVGFDQNNVTEGMGLHNIRQRIAAFQGKISIYSSEQGTEINVELDITKDN